MVVKPSPNYHFWCLQQVENNNFGGCFQKFWKIRVRKNFFFLNLNRKFWKIQFSQNFINQTILFFIKYQFGMISAFIWYIYCPYWSKIIAFQKFRYWKLKNLSPEMRLLWSQIVEKFWITEWFSKIL